MSMLGVKKKKVLLSFANSRICSIFAVRWENPSMGCARILAYTAPLYIIILYNKTKKE